MGYSLLVFTNLNQAVLLQTELLTENIIMRLLTTKNKIIASTLFLVSVMLSQTAQANTNSGGIDQKQANQALRITQGIDSGALTGKEAVRLGLQQGHIYNKEQRFKADGQFTARERAIINRDLLKTSNRIYRQKHDRQVQGGVRAVSAGSKKLGIHKRQKNQGKRIRQGVKSGQLTARETKKLAKQQKSIQRQKRRFKADGTFTKRERVVVHQRQKRASKNIYRNKHNRRTQ